MAKQGPSQAYLQVPSSAQAFLEVPCTLCHLPSPYSGHLPTHLLTCLSRLALPDPSCLPAVPPPAPRPACLQSLSVTSISSAMAVGRNIGVAARGVRGPARRMMMRGGPAQVRLWLAFPTTTSCSQAL